MVTSVEHSTFNQNAYQAGATVSSTAGVSHVQETPITACRRVSLRSIANELNPRASTPLHDQLFGLLKSALEEGLLEDVCEGSLPSLRNMSSMLGLSRETVSKAISKLAGYGYLSAEERKRIYVIPRKDDAQRSQPIRDEGPQGDTFDHEFNGSARGLQLDFRPPSNTAVSPGGYGKNYLTEKYLKNLRRQSAKRARFDLDACGLVSFREVLCEQLKRDSNLECRAENLIVFSDFRSCADFIIRLTTKGCSTCVVEAPGSQEIRSILDWNGLSVVEIPVDEEGMRADILSSYGLNESVCFVSPSMQDPLGVRLSPHRIESLLDWGKSTKSVIVETSTSQGFLRLGSTPLLWKPASDEECVYAWTVTSALKPWTQICCALFSDGLIKEARRLKSTIGGEVAITEQTALQDFILDGDLPKAQRQRELVNLEKRRRLGLAFSRIFKGDVSMWRGNCGPKLVFEVGGNLNPTLIVETSRMCGLSVRVLNEHIINDQSTLDRCIVLDLDLVNTEAISSKIENLESLLSGMP